MRKPEVLLLAAIIMLWGAHSLWGRRPAVSDEQTVSWRQQEQQTRADLRRAMDADRSALESKLRHDPEVRRRFQGLIFGLLLLGLGVAFQWGRLLLRWFFRAPPEPRLGSPAPATWGFREIFRLVLAIVLLIECSIVLQSLIFRFFQPSWLDRRVGALADTLLVDIFAAAAAGWFVFRNGGGWGDRSKILASIRAGIRSYLIAVPLLFGMLVAVAIVLHWMKIEPPPQAVFTMYLSEQRPLVVRILLGLAVVAGPIAEEIFFRGLVYGWLRQRIGIGKGLFLSALFFALLHMDPVAFFPILGLGLLFGWVYERTGSLAAPAAIHILHNGGMLFVASVVKSIMAHG